jgi:hypothetical protein
MTWLSHLNGTCVRAVSLPANGDVELQRGRLKFVLVAGRRSVRSQQAHNRVQGSKKENQGRLVIHGEHRDEHADEQEGRTLREVRYGSFHRSFQLPAHVTGEGVAASYDAGLLTVRVTGAYSGSQAQKIAITR